MSLFLAADNENYSRCFEDRDYEFWGSIQFWGGLGNSINWRLILTPILMENGNNTNSTI